MFVQDSFFKQQDKNPLSKSSKTTNRHRIQIYKLRKSSINRSNSASNIKDINKFENNHLFNQKNLTPILTNKSSLIYQLMRSRLEP
ncbi:unnamed protein product, partial [Rotaria sp. Silwood2]